MLRKTQPTVQPTVALYEFRGPIFVGNKSLDFQAGDILSEADLAGVAIENQVKSGALRRLTAEEATAALAEIEAQEVAEAELTESELTTADEPAPAESTPAEVTPTESTPVEPVVAEPVTAEPVVTETVETPPVDGTPPVPVEVATETATEEPKAFQNPGSGFRNRRGY